MVLHTMGARYGWPNQQDIDIYLIDIYKMLLGS